MNGFGQKIRELRIAAQQPLRKVAAFVDMDQAILSKIERGQRKALREQVLKFAEYFKVKEEDLLLLWLSDKVLYDLGDDPLAMKALKVAEVEMEYQIFQKMDRGKIIKNIKEGILHFPQIKKAWIYGSFSREDDRPDSDVDIALKTTPDFSYFDLAEVQYQLEKRINRKVDVGFLNSFKDYIFEHVKPDLKLIYEKR